MRNTKYTELHITSSSLTDPFKQTKEPQARARGVQENSVNIPKHLA